MGTLVQVPTPLYEAASDTTIVHSFDSDVTVLSVIVCSVHGYSDTITVTGVTATAAREITFTQVGTLLRATGSTPDTYLTMWVGTVLGTSGPCTITATYSATQDNRTMSMWEISGVMTASLISAGGISAGTGVGTGNVSMTVPGFVIKVEHEFNWTTHDEAAGTPSTGWTEVGDNATGFDSAWQNFPTAPGTLNGGFTNGVSTAACCRLVGLPNLAPPPAVPYQNLFIPLIAS